MSQSQMMFSYNKRSIARVRIDLPAANDFRTFPFFWFGFSLKVNRIDFTKTKTCLLQTDDNSS